MFSLQRGSGGGWSGKGEAVSGLCGTEIMHGRRWVKGMTRSSGNRTWVRQKNLKAGEGEDVEKWESWRMDGGGKRPELLESLSIWGGNKFKEVLC